MHAFERPRAGMTMKDDHDVLRWKHSLPTAEELTPLSKSLLSPAFSSAFSIKPAPLKNGSDVSRESLASLLDLRTQSQRSSLPSFFKERKDAGAHDFTLETRNDEGRGDGKGDSLVDRRGKVFAGYAVEGRGDVRGDARGDLRGEIRGGAGDAALEIGIGLGLGNGSSSDRVTEKPGSASHATGAYNSQGHGGHALPAVFPTGSDGTSYSPSEGRSEHSSGLPFMMSYGSFDRRPESSYRGDESSKGGVSGKNVRKLADSDFEDTDSAGGPVNSNEEPNARTLKRPRLVWTPQLHKRFVDAVGHLGIKNAVPKTIMQLMNVEGLTRENVASHLQKYRLYLKRMQGLSSDSSPASDQLFASTPLPPSLGLHYVPKQRDDIGPPSFSQPAVPMPFQGLGSLGPAHFSAYEHIPYSAAMSRGLMQRPTMKDRSEHTSESENNNHQHHSHMHHSHSPSHQPSSPPKRLLSLFPTTSS